MPRKEAKRKIEIGDNKLIQRFLLEKPFVSLDVLEGALQNEKLSTIIEKFDDWEKVKNMAKLIETELKLPEYKRPDIDWSENASKMMAFFKRVQEVEKMYKKQLDVAEKGNELQQTQKTLNIIDAPTKPNEELAEKFVRFVKSLTEKSSPAFGSVFITEDLRKYFKYGDNNVNILALSSIQLTEEDKAAAQEMYSIHQGFIDHFIKEYEDGRIKNVVETWNPELGIEQAKQIEEAKISREDHMKKVKDWNTLHPTAAIVMVSPNEEEFGGTDPLEAANVKDMTTAQRQFFLLLGVDIYKERSFQIKNLQPKNDILPSLEDFKVNQFYRLFKDLKTKGRRRQIRSRPTTKAIFHLLGSEGLL